MTYLEQHYPVLVCEILALALEISEENSSMITHDGTVISHAEVSPHKFGGDPMAEFLYTLNMDSSFDRITGDACDWFYIVSQYGKRLLFNDSQGFVWVDKYATVAEASAVFDSIAEDFDTEYPE